MLGSPIQFDPEPFGVQVAKNRGKNVQIFWDRKAAADWLAGPGAPPRG